MEYEGERSVLTQVMGWVCGPMEVLGNEHHNRKYLCMRGNWGHFEHVIQSTNKRINLRLAKLKPWFCT